MLESARQLAGLDFCAVTLVSETGGQARPPGDADARASRRRAARRSRAAIFADNNGLVANVVRYGAPLPGRDLKAMDRQVIFDDETQMRGLGALKIFPLTRGRPHPRDAGGRLAPQDAALDHDVLRMLEVIAIQAAQAVLRAQLYEQMERMATTDGLTGLFNHRTFQCEGGRDARPVAALRAQVLAHAHGHRPLQERERHLRSPDGRPVLKGVARILREQARDTDMVARYGGEEFCHRHAGDGHGQGAKVIAERIREAIKAEVFQTEMGPLKVTCRWASPPARTTARTSRC